MFGLGIKLKEWTESPVKYKIRSSLIFLPGFLGRPFWVGSAHHNIHFGTHSVKYQIEVNIITSMACAAKCGENSNNQKEWSEKKACCECKALLGCQEDKLSSRHFLAVLGGRVILQLKAAMSEYSLGCLFKFNECASNFRGTHWHCCAKKMKMGRDLYR